MRSESFTKVLTISLIGLSSLTSIGAPFLRLVRADQTISLDLKSDTSTLVAGYTTSEPESPLDPFLYSGNGEWSPAVVVGFYHWLEPRFIGSNAVWINNAFNWSEAGTGDAWRLFKAEFTLPSDITVQSASINITADDAFEIWFNGAVIGTSGNVNGEAPADPFSDPGYSEVFGPYAFAPVSGFNTLYFVVRNYDIGIVYNFYSNGDTNPTGLLYSAKVTYLRASQSVAPYIDTIWVAVGIVFVGIATASSFLIYRHKRGRASQS